MTLDEFNNKGFKPGDILMVYNRWLIIFAGFRESIYGRSVRHAFLFHAFTAIDEPYNVSACIDGPRPGIGYVEDRYTIKLATNMEKRILFDRIKKSHGVIWNGQNLEKIHI
jgi:hypothetical protein